MNYLDEYLKTLSITYDVTSNDEFIIEFRNKFTKLTFKYYSFDKELIIPFTSEFYKFHDNEYEEFSIRIAINKIYDLEIDRFIFVNGQRTADF